MGNIERLAAYLEEHHIAFRRDVPLREKCTFRVGGPADLLAEPAGEAEIAGIVPFAAKLGVPLLVLGRGSNVLFADEGYRGAILHLGEGFGRVWQDSPTRLRCEGGAGLSALCEFARQKGMTGLEFAYGIPGTVGGAVYMNAGAYGAEMKDVLCGARVVLADGSVRELGVEQMGLSYRRSVFMELGGVITGAAFRLAPGDPGEIRARMDGFMARRREKQPLEYPSAGSTFKRPEGHYASALIDQCGLKGLRVGGAAVSEKHAGFVVNLGGAGSKDIRALIGKIQARVKEQTGYELECEVKIIEG